MEVNREISLIFGQTFLATTKANIKVKEGILSLSIGKNFNILKSTPCPDQG